MPGVTFHCKDIKILAIYYIEEGFCHHGDIVNDSVQSTNKTGQRLEVFIAKHHECFKASWCKKIKDICSVFLSAIKIMSLNSIEMQTKEQ